jgi:hypothetical protein
MNREFFNTQFTALLSVFTYAQKMPDQGQDVYWEMLKDIPQEKFAEGVQACLAICKFFPTIAELGEASLPPIRDYKAPLPPIDQPFAMLNWRDQIKRSKEVRAKLIEQQSQKQIGRSTA